MGMPDPLHDTWLGLWVIRSLQWQQDSQECTSSFVQ